VLSGSELFGLKPRVTFGEVIAGENHKHVIAEIEEAARRTLQQHIAWAHA